MKATSRSKTFDLFLPALAAALVFISACKSVPPAGGDDTDGDGDGYTKLEGGDCDDVNASVHPGAVEACLDGIDNNCDGVIDGQDLTACKATAAGCVDADEDGSCAEDDCDDRNAFTHPGQSEHCRNRIDDNCDDHIDRLTAGDPAGNLGPDSQCPDLSVCPDADADGFSNVACGGTDCNDADANANPFSGEDCGDGIDNNCDSRVDRADPQCPPPGSCPGHPEITNNDVDGDMQVNVVCGGGDCNDGDASVKMGASESCSDSIDKNCDSVPGNQNPACMVCLDPGCMMVPATCNDGVKNGTETDVDCGGSCAPAKQCVPTQGCAATGDCTTGICGPGNSCPPSTSCSCQAPSCTDGMKNGSETGVDCGGSCVASAGKACFFDQGCASGVDCFSGTCGASGVTGSSGACPQGQTCACHPATCASSCAIPNQICVNGACQCPQGMSECGGSCIIPTDDPNNCGYCGHVCNVGGGEVCSSGACKASCLPGVTECNGKCYDKSSSNEQCGGGAGLCAPTGATACTGTKVCNYGACVTPLVTLTKPAKCIGSGPAINLGLAAGTGSTTCAGNLAAITFRWGVCACRDFSITHPLLIDSFDSTIGPYDPTAPTGERLGAGLGANGTIKTGTSDMANIFGDTWASRTVTDAGNADTIDSGAGINVFQRTFCAANPFGDGLSAKASTTHFYDDMYIADTMSFNSGTATAHKNLYSSTYSAAGTGATIAGALRVQGNVINGPVTFNPPCDCSSPLNIAGIVSSHACSSSATGPSGCLGDNNDNFEAKLNPALFSGAGGRVDLECGHYWLAGATITNPTTIFVHGNVALYISGNIAVSGGGQINITLAPTAQLDVFVSGTLAATQGTVFGNKNYPANMRMYIGGGSPSIDAIAITQSVEFALNLYAPYGRTNVTQTNENYGSVFTRKVSATQEWKIHYDRAVVGAGDVCSRCGDGFITSGEQCEAGKLGGQSCQTLGFSGGTLSCDVSTCQLVNNCFRCGDSVKNGTEQCDRTDFGSATCPGGGARSCTSDCRLSCSGGTCGATGSTGVDPGEQCDGTTLPSGSACTGYPHTPPYTGGSVACAGCQLDFSGCFYCGDGIRQSSEACDGAVFPTGVTCSTETGDRPNGSLTCTAMCAIDSSGCTVTSGCSSCNDCNNQACVNGSCGACTDTSQCCSPLQCLGGTCQLASECPVDTNPATGCNGPNLNCCFGQDGNSPQDYDGNSFIDCGTPCGTLLQQCGLTTLIGTGSGCP